MRTIPRHLKTRVERALGFSRVVNIVGPRQVGKTTLARDLIPSARYVTLDDDGVRSALEADPYGQLQLLKREAEGSGRPIVIDEVQRAPGITLALKRIVDEDPRPGQFLLTGSSDIFASGATYDSLAGRVHTLTLRPLSTAEVLRAQPCLLLDVVTEHIEAPLKGIPEPLPYARDQAVDLIVRGGFPEIRHLEDTDRADRYLSYLDSIIERDVAPVAAVRKPDTLRRLMNQIASRTAQELNVSALSRTLGVRAETVNSYLDVLDRLGLVQRLGAWTAGSARREIKAPKLHFMDTGCVTAVRGEDASSFGFGADPGALGPVLETMVFAEIEKTLPYLAKRWRLYHWRMTSREIDLVAEAPGMRLALIEVKAGATAHEEDFRHIDWFLDEGPGRRYRGVGFVIHLGDQVLSFGPNRIALPMSALWSYR